MSLQKASADTSLHSSARPTGRRIATGAVAVVITVALAILIWPDGLPVELATVTRGPMEVTVQEDGRTRVRDRYVVAAPFTATLLRVSHDPGDRVSSGDPLVEFVPATSPLNDPTSQAQARARVAAADAALQRAHNQKNQASAALALAEQDTRRQRVLLEQTSGTPVALEAAELAQRMREQDVSSADFGIEIAEQELQIARVAARPASSDGRQVAVEAPVDGIILRVVDEGGHLVQAGSPVLEMGDPTALEVVIDVLTVDAPRIRAGCDVILERWGGDPLRGTVRQVEPSAFTRVSALGVEEQRVNVIVDPVGSPEQWVALGDGYRVEARIVVWSTQNAVQVPVNALFKSGEEWAVFVVVGGRAQLSVVEVGEWGSQTVQVLGGLSEGDEVVSYPSDAVEDGIRVQG